VDVATGTDVASEEAKPVVARLHTPARRGRAASGVSGPVKQPTAKKTPKPADDHGGSAAARHRRSAAGTKKSRTPPSRRTSTASRAPSSVASWGGRRQSVWRWQGQDARDRRRRRAAPMPAIACRSPCRKNTYTTTEHHCEPVQ
jgi:hypothetical protein